jgi:soluble lytic murein transglycosylase-like protein
MRGVLWVGLGLIAAGSPLEASSTEPSAVVFLSTGGSLEAEKVERLGDWTFLQLSEGGELAVRSDDLLEIKALPRSRAPRSEAPKAEPQPLRPAPVVPAPPAADSGTETASAGTQSAREVTLRLVEEAAAQHDLHPDLLAAMVRVESNFDATAVSRRGAQGLLQLMPETARKLEVEDPFDPRQNLEAGARLMRVLIDRYKGDIVFALAAYNAGEEAVKKHDGIPPFEETRLYVDRVLTHFERGY